ncbi:MAG: hypothetical protein EAZ43_10540 [Betaproteobacteria bacterium]|nr:MAG: hypothetical protein EAZ43_10540 [Betaproteobacteria bacterium]
MTQHSNQPPKKSDGKPGEWLLIIGFLLVLVPPIVLAIVHNEAAEYSQLKSQGVVAEAQVQAHEQRAVYGGVRKGRDRSTTSHILEVRLDAMAATSYAEWKATRALRVSKYPAMVTRECEVSQSDIANHPVGSKHPVLFLKNNLTRMELVSTVERETSFAYFLKYYLAMGALFLAGAAMTVAGWRKWKAQS